ncbi:MAG: universal stress protein [Ramlibacter sp.]
MTTDKKVLACVAPGPLADRVTDAAAWAATRLAAPLELLHVLERHPEVATGDDHSGAIGVDAQQALLAQLSEKDAQQSRTAREQGRLFLNRLRERARASGVEAPDVRQRHGTLGATLLELEGAAQLIVLGRVGQHGTPGGAPGQPPGHHGDFALKALKAPVLWAADDFRAPARVLLALDDGQMAPKLVAQVAASFLFKGLQIQLLMTGPARADAPRELASTQASLVAAGLELSAALVPGDAAATVAQALKTHHADLLVLGAHARSPWRRLLQRDPTRALLRAACVSILLLR